MNTNEKQNETRTTAPKKKKKKKKNTHTHTHTHCEHEISFSNMMNIFKKKHFCKCFTKTNLDFLRYHLTFDFD